MNNFDKWKQELTIEKALNGFYSCNFCIMSNDGEYCGETDIEICKKYLRKYFEQENDDVFE